MLTAEYPGSGKGLSVIRRVSRACPSGARAENIITSPATPRYGAMTRATGREIAMAATFMIKLIIIMTKKAMLITNTNQLAS